jgi:TPR repeat protein
MYENGRGVLQHHFEAVKWYGAAAERGDVFGQYHMGLCHLHGKGATKDLGQAYKWLKLAADQELIDGLSEELKSLVRSMSQDQLRTGEAMYREASKAVGESKIR